jgi:hypothetical protein
MLSLLQKYRKNTMRKPLLSRGLILVGVCLLSVAALPGVSQNLQRTAQRVPGFFDWSMVHVIYPRTGPMDKMIAAERDPRAMMIWQRQLGRVYWRGRTTGTRYTANGATAKHPDWSIYLGQSGTAAAMFPAEFDYNASGAPDCVNDFIVFPVNAGGTDTQPNIVAFDELYSGTDPAGICNRTPSASDSGTSAEVYWSYNVHGITGGAVTTSPTYSYDQTGVGTGTKIAFVESGNGKAHFHVLAWQAGDGQNASDLQSVGLGEIFVATVDTAERGTGYAVGDEGTISGGSTANGATLATYTVATLNDKTTGAVGKITITAPAGFGYATGNGVATTATSGNGTGLEVHITSVGNPETINSSTFVTVTPVIGSGTATDLAFGNSTDTLSSPFIDYQHDMAYVGTDDGRLYRIKDVFCMGINGANPDCTNESIGPAPSIDTTWGGQGYVQVCAGKLSSPDYDYGTGNVFVGCENGNLYSVSQTGAVSSLLVGTGTTYGGIVDGPAVDEVNGFVYAVSGAGSASGGANGVLVQTTTTDLASNVMVPVGTGDDCNIHEPIPNNAYLTGITTDGAAVYVAGVTGSIPSCTPTSNATGPTLELYAVGLTGNGTLRPGAPAGSDEGGGPGYEWAPMTDFYNATLGNEFLFLGTLQDQINVASVDLTTGVDEGKVQEGMGVTGMVVDNDSSDAQASSFYFGALGENTTCNNKTVTTDAGGCAVKLTQATVR